MRKRIMFSAYIPGSLHVLRDYFEQRLAEDNRGVKVIFHDHYHISKLRHLFLRVVERLRRYDISFADYPSRVACRGRKNFYISHGYGTKCSPGLDEYASEEKMAVIANMRGKLDALITLSEWDATYYWRAPAFDNLPYPQVLPYGLPRNDVLFSPEYLKGQREAFDAKHDTQGKFLVLYAPTWRGYDIQYPMTPHDFEKLDKQLGKINAVMLYRPHYIENLFAGMDFENANLENIWLCDIKKYPDSAELLCVSDMLLTDYSSIFVDFIATQRPVAYLALDIQQYSSFRGLVIDYENDTHTPGPKLKNLKGLTAYIQDIQADKDAYAPARAQALHHYYTYPDGDSSERIWAALLKGLGSV